MPVASERRIRLTAASDAMMNAAMGLTDKAAAMLERPGTGRMVDELIALIGQLNAESERSARGASVRFPGTPTRRWRGDPADVSPYPPTLNDLSAVWRWLREWQCREGASTASVGLGACERGHRRTGTAEGQGHAQTASPGQDPLGTEGITMSRRRLPPLEAPAKLLSEMTPEERRVVRPSPAPPGARRAA